MQSASISIFLHLCAYLHFLAIVAMYQEKNTSINLIKQRFRCWNKLSFYWFIQLNKFVSVKIYICIHTLFSGDMRHNNHHGLSSPCLLFLEVPWSLGDTLCLPNLPCLYFPGPFWTLGQRAADLQSTLMQPASKHYFSTLNIFLSIIFYLVLCAGGSWSCFSCLWVFVACWLWSCTQV